MHGLKILKWVQNRNTIVVGCDIYVQSVMFVFGDMYAEYTSWVQDPSLEQVNILYIDCLKYFY